MIKKWFSYLLLMVLVLTLVVPASLVWVTPTHADGNWLAGYSFRKEIPITGASGAGDNYQVSLEVHSGSGSDSNGVVYLSGKCQDFPTDIRFTDDDGETIIPYWLSPGSGDTRTFWIRITDDLSSNQTFFIYYGNASPQAFDIPPLGFWDERPQSDNYFTPDNGAIIENLVWDSDTSKYYVIGVDITPSGGGGVIFYSSASVDATSWTDEGIKLGLGAGGQWDDKAVGANHLFKYDGTWYLYYHGHSVTPANLTSVGYATASSVLGPYTKSESNPVLSYAPSTWESVRSCEAHVFEDSGTWYMFYMGDDDWVEERIGYATASSPGGPWTKYGGNPVLDLGAAGQWDELAVADPFGYVFTNNVGDKQRYIFYTGTRLRDPTADQRASIGYAEANPSYTTFTKRTPMLFYNPGSWDDMIIRGAITLHDDYYYHPYAAYDGTWHWGIATMSAKSTDVGFPPQQVFNTFDDFSNNLSQWRIHPDEDNANWSIVSERLQNSDNTAYVQDIFIPGEAYSSYTYDVTAQRTHVEGEDDACWFGVLFGVQDHPTDLMTSLVIFFKDSNYWVGWRDNQAQESFTEIQDWTDIYTTVKDEYTENGYNQDWAASNVNWTSQSFTASSNYTVGGVRCKVAKQGTAVSGNVVVSLRLTDGAGKPTGADLSSTGSTDWYSLPEYDAMTNGVWRTFDIGDYAVTQDTKYAIVMRTDTVNALARWDRDNVGGYAGGIISKSLNSGSTWETPDESGDDDRMFEVLDDTPPFDADVEHDYKVIAEVGKFRFYIDDVLIYTNNAPPTNPTLGGVGVIQRQGTVWFDDVRVRKYVDSEPVVGIAYGEQGSGPVVETEAATNPTATTMLLHGYITSVGAGDCDERGFDWGKTDSYGLSWTEEGTFGIGTFSHTIGSLDPSTTYHFRAKAHNSEGWGYGEDMTLATASALPTVTSDPVMNLGVTTVTLRGYLNDQGIGTCAWRFQYGETTEYGTNTPWTGAIGTGTPFSTYVTDLDPTTLYHFRAQAQNSHGTGSGSDRTFTTYTTAGDPSDLLAIATSATEVSLSWTKGEGAPYTMIRYATNNYPSDQYSGTQAYYGTEASTELTSLTGGVTYFFRAWGFDEPSHWSSGYTSALVTTPAGAPSGDLPWTFPDSPPWFLAPDPSKMVNFPLYPFFASAAARMGISLGSLFSIAGILLAVGAGIATARTTNSLIVTAVAVETVLWLCFFAGIVAGWIPFAFLVFAVTIMYLGSRL